MGFIRGALIILFSIITIFFLILLSFGITAYSLLYPSIYLESFEKAGIYDHVNQQLSEDSSVFIKIPDKGIKPLLETFLANTLSFIRSETDTLDLKVEIDKEKILRFFLESAQNTTICPPGVDPFLQEEITCRPADKTPEEFLEEIFEKKNLTFLEGNETDLAPIFGLTEGSEGMQALNNIRNIVNYYRIALAAISFIILFTILIIFLLEKHSFKKIDRTVGVNLLITGIILILFSISSNDLISRFMNIENEILNKLAEVFASSLLNRITLAGIIIIALCIGLFVISFFIRKKDENKNKIAKFK